MLKRQSIVWLLIAIVLVPSMASAIRRGRLIGKVLDPEGNPIEGVTVVSTCKSVPDYRETDTSDDKGLFKIDFSELDRVYVLRFEKNGYHPLESEKTWRKDGKAREEFTMYPGQATVADVPLASGSNDAVYNFNMGVEAFNSEDYGTAIERFKKALEFDPELHQAWAALGKIYVKQEKYEDAVAATEKAIELGSTDQTVWQSRYEAYRNLGDEEKTAQALAELEDAGYRAEQARMIHNEAVALANAGDQEAAYQKFKEALAVDPNLLEATLGLAMTAVETGRHAEAAEAAAAILKGNPDNEQAIRIRYNAALQTKDPETIIGSLESLAKVEPDVARDGLLKFAFDAYDVNDMETAKARFIKVLEVDPTHYLTHYYLALIYVNENAKEDAITHLQEFLRLAPEDNSERATASELLKFLQES